MKRHIICCLVLVLLLAVGLMGWTSAAEANDADYEVTLLDTEGNVIRTYDTLVEAISTKYESKVIVRLEKNITLHKGELTIPENVTLTIPKDVTFVIPCMDNDPGYVSRNGGELAFNPDGTDTAGTVGQGPNAYLYCKLTIPKNARMIVQGTILVNAVTGREAAGHYDMDVTGGYAQIDLEGEIYVLGTGKLDCFGYVKGNGFIEAYSGGVVGDLYIVRHWRGGTHGLAMYGEGVYPINEADCRNIEADVIIHEGASLVGLVKMYASNSYHYTRFPQVHQTNGLIRLEKDAVVRRSYSIDGEREIYEITGGAKFSASAMVLQDHLLTSSDYLYPIDGDMDIILKDGDYSFVNDYKVLPGATVTVKSDATLTVAEQAYLETPDKDIADDGRVTVVFYNEFEDRFTGPTQYPLNQPAAKLILEDGSSFTNKGSFAGTIVTTTENVLVEEGIAPAWTVTSRESEEALVVKDGEPGKRHVKLDFQLIIERDDYTWEINETNGRIMWLRKNATSADAAVTQESGKAVVEGVLYNTTDEEMHVEYLMVAVYDAANRMLSMDMKPVGIVEKGGKIYYNIELPASDVVSYARAFVVGKGFLPLG